MVQLWMTRGQRALAMQACDPPLTSEPTQGQPSLHSKCRASQRYTVRPSSSENPIRYCEMKTEQGESVEAGEPATLECSAQQGKQEPSHPHMVGSKT